MKIKCWSVDQRINRQPSFQRTKNHVPSSGNLLIFFYWRVSEIYDFCAKSSYLLEHKPIWWESNPKPQAVCFLRKSFQCSFLSFSLILLQIFPYKFAPILNSEKLEIGFTVLFWFSFRFASYQKGMAYPNTGAWLPNRCHSLRGFYKRSGLIYR